MIKLNKIAIPEVLQRNAERWTTAVLEKLRESIELAKTEKNRYNHAEVKAALINETHGKCAYCESKLNHIAYGDIEHILPKNPNPHLWFEWTNLTLACDICNTNKGQLENIFDPYTSDPEEAFHFIGSSIWARPSNETAKYTVIKLDLNREELLERRQEKIERLMQLVEIISNTNLAALVAALKEDFSRELDSDKEFAALSRNIAHELRAKGLIN